jgi:hypothetical protein
MQSMTPRINHPGTPRKLSCTHSLPGAPASAELVSALPDRAIDVAALGHVVRPRIDPTLLYKRVPRRNDAIDCDRQIDAR